MPKSSSSGGRSGRGGGLASVPATTASFAVGDVVRFPSTSRSSGYEGVVTKVSRVNITVGVEYYGGRTLSLTNRAGDFAGGLRARGDTVVRFE